MRLSVLMSLGNLHGEAARHEVAAALASVGEYRRAHPGSPTDAQDKELVEFGTQAPAGTPPAP